MDRKTGANSNGLNELVQTIRDRTIFDHATGDSRILETHISYILLTGDYAYKFKKPLDLGFLDFTRLERRKFYCYEEVRLNRRLAPDLYIDVVSVTGNKERPVIGGDRDVLEYAVKMLRFPEGSELDRVMKSGKLTASIIDILARQISTFHRSVAVDTANTRFGSLECIHEQVMLNFSTIKQNIQNDPVFRERLQELETWTTQALKQLSEIFNDRKLSGCIRECHGDLHLGNIAIYSGKPLIFDCVEFSDELRWIDVISEAAFLVMDLEAHQQRGLAKRFLNGYLQNTGDFQGLLLLRFYLIYRALVRAKVACIRLAQTNLNKGTRLSETERYRRYIELAGNYIKPVPTFLIITHGLSGSGKTTLSKILSEQLDTIRIVSDVERKRFHGFSENENTGSTISSGIYTETETVKTYDRLVEQAETILKAGYPVIIDAAFLKKSQRRLFFVVAMRYSVPFIILDLVSDDVSLRRRITERNRKGSDASEADIDVLDFQIATRQPLDKDEMEKRINIDTSNLQDPLMISQQILEKILNYQVDTIL